MYQAIETDNLIVKPMDILADGDNNTMKNKSCFSNSKIMYMIYFFTSCLLMLTIWSVMLNHNSNELDLTLVQGSFEKCTSPGVQTGNDFALFKGQVKVKDITIHGLWPQSKDGECYSCKQEISNIPCKLIFFL